MSNREKIIVGLMLLTVAYGVYALFFEGKSKGSKTVTAAVSATEQLENLNAFITKVAEASRAGLSEEDTYIISRAETAWKQDPMTMVELTDIPEDEIGFMQMGDRKFAIINGLEYTTGDELEQGGFKVRSITPRQVVIVSTDRSKKKFIFLIEE
jgi:hypothetical protein